MPTWIGSSGLKQNRNLSCTFHVGKHKDHKGFWPLWPATFSYCSCMILWFLFFLFCFLFLFSSSFSCFPPLAPSILPLYFRWIMSFFTILDNLVQPADPPAPCIQKSPIFQCMGCSHVWATFPLFTLAHPSSHIPTMSFTIVLVLVDVACAPNR